MKRHPLFNSLALMITATGSAIAQDNSKDRAGAAEPGYTIAFASFGPLNTDIFVADADGENPKPFLAHPGLDYNASFSPDDKWVVFTSERNGSADIYRSRLDGSGLERLTDEPAFDDQAALSPDGKSLAFVSSRSGQADIWILDLVDRKLRNLTDHPAGDFRPSWSPDRQWIAFSSDRESKKPRGAGGFAIQHSTELFLVRPDGSGLRRLTHAQSFAGSPSWSRDGKRLVFYEAELNEVNNIVRVQRYRGTTQITTLDLETGRRRVLTSGSGEKWSPRWLAQDRIAHVSGGPEGGLEFSTGTAGARGEFGSPRWSADGSRVVFHREAGAKWETGGTLPSFGKSHSHDPQFRLVRTGVFPSASPAGDRLVCNPNPGAIHHNSITLVTLDGAPPTVLFSDADPNKSAVAPAWSPLGDKIAFGLGRFFQTVLGPAVGDIAVMRSDGTGVTILTDGKGNIGFPSWAPDGKHLVCRSSISNTSWLMILNTDTRELKPLNTGSTHENFPAWSPAGDRIAFTSYRDGDYDLYTVKPDGTDLNRLTSAPGNDAHCAWSPDGKWIAFASGREGFKDEAALHPYNGQPYGEIYVVRADGSDARKLTDNQFEDGSVSFIPTPRPKQRRSP